MKNRDKPASPFMVEASEDAQAQRGAHIYPIYYTGLSKREHFAGLAMQGDWAAQSESEGSFMNHMTEDDCANRAKVYLKAADGLLKALEETE